MWWKNTPETSRSWKRSLAVKRHVVHIWRSFDGRMVSVVGAAVGTDRGRFAARSGVRWLWLSNFSYGRHYFPGHAYSAAGVVSSHVVGDHSEEWCQGIRVAASAGAEELRDGLDMAA